MTDQHELILSPGVVAKRLGVSPSGLRRLAGVYASVYGELPKDTSGTSRLWSEEAVSRLETARALLGAGQARSIRDALHAEASGALPSLTLAEGEGQHDQALRVVATQLAAIQQGNDRLERELRELRAEVAEMKALPPPAGPAKGEPLLVRLARRVSGWLGRP